MIDKTQSLEVKNGTANYTGWRGELLAELALARVPELSVHKPKEDLGYDFLVATPSGVCFFVLVKAFSSKKLNIENIAEIAELRWRIEIDQIARTKESHTPVFVFLIDADTDHGRFSRLDTIEPAARRSPSHSIHFPIGNTLDKAGIERLIAALEQDAKAMSR
ncbi:MAG: DUF4365 domain-containing protein [Planctomycetaceae bacterium]